MGQEASCKTTFKGKTSSGKATPAGRAAGLVDVKVVSFSATQTAEKFVIPVANRDIV